MGAPKVMTRHLVRLLTGALVAWTLSAADAHADIYTYVDENGVLNFTNSHPVGRKKFRRIFKEESPKSAIRSYAPRVTPTEYDTHIFTTCAKYDVDPALVKAIIHTESAFNPYAVSPKGAEGLMQLMPETAGMVNVADSFDPYANIEGGVRYFKYLLQRFDGNIKLSLAAYNAGETNVQKYGGVPPFKETREYVRKVMALWQSYQKPRD